MAVIERLRCLACGSLRKEDAFGIRDNEFQTDHGYEFEAGIQTIGGRGKCSWVFATVDFAAAYAQLQGLRLAVARAEAELADVAPTEYERREAASQDAG